MNVRDDPVLFLEWFLAASQRPDRHTIGWEEDDLLRASKSWHMASLALFADAEVIYERERFVALRKQLLDDALKYALQGEPAWGYLTMDGPSDWASSAVIKRAIRALKRDNIRVMAA